MDSYEIQQHYDFYVENLGENNIPLSYTEWFSDIWQREKHNFEKCTCFDKKNTTKSEDEPIICEKHGIIL